MEWYTRLVRRTDFAYSMLPPRYRAVENIHQSLRVFQYTPRHYQEYIYLFRGLQF